MTQDGAGPLYGLMQDWPLTIDRLLEHAARWHGSRELVSRRGDGTLERTSYRTLLGEAKRLSDALLDHGIGPGDRVATLAMNSAAHLAAWYAISGIGAVCHTLNPRLFDDQLTYIINHASDRLVLADGPFAPLLSRIAGDCPSIERFIFLSAASEPRPPHSISARAFSEGFAGKAQWGGFDERLAAGLCYTSGTTGRPKGVLYSHRSNVLHAITSIQPDLFNLSERDVVLPIVPFYHANAWALCFSTPAVGAKLVLPGASLDGASLHQLIVDEGVTFAAAVPTVWLSLFDHLDATGSDLGGLQRVIVGGAAMPERILRRFHELGIAAQHAWGMTEMSPIGTVGAPTHAMAGLPFEQQLPWRLKQGRPPWGVDMRLLSAGGEAVPHDGQAMGRLQVRGPAIASAYLGSNEVALDGDGWFDTGDIATIDAEGFMRITDRSKDIIKSGGEWISSLELETTVLAHPKIVQAAAVGVPHPRWDERPVLFVVAAQGEHVSQTEILEFLQARVAKWWLPDAVHLVEDLPLGATGKVDKKPLRDAARERAAQELK